MMQLVHGGDWAGYRAQYGQDALDFSANVSPLGLPEGVAKAITAALATADRYPDPLCRELRQFLVEHVSKTGGHLASNLGAVELTVAIHRVFDTSKDRLVFDVGHQCYVHKALTGRQALFDTLRQFGGLSAQGPAGH